MKSKELPGHLVRPLTSKNCELIMPQNFIPRPYQDLIINHEIDIQRCNILADMGKTVATLTALEDLFSGRV
ncbi:hypothetical protein [Raoultella terrigena]|uniref:hypothetical protein n=1 Tax=Raoultella terrigena TaxID=577 RepID=UPI003891A6BB